VRCGSLFFGIVHCRVRLLLLCWLEAKIVFDDVQPRSNVHVRAADDRRPISTIWTDTPTSLPHHPSLNGVRNFCQCGADLARSVHIGSLWPASRIPFSLTT